MTLEPSPWTPASYCCRKQMPDRRPRRFLMQAALDIPMTVYGTGGQTRGFIHVTDTAKCLEAAVVNPPPSNGPVEIFNQARRFLFRFGAERSLLLVGGRTFV